MKKLYPLLLILLGLSVYAGNTPGNGVTLRSPKNFPDKSKYFQNSRATNIILDYDSADALSWSMGGIDYARFIWDMNSRFSGRPDSATIGHIVVAYDSLFDPYTETAYSNGGVFDITVDSIIAFIGHENNSGANDTLIVKIVDLASNGYPTNTVLWSDTIITDMGASPNNDWSSVVALTLPVGQNFYEKRFGVRLEYFGALEDTMGFIAGFGDQGPCGMGTVSAYPSNFPDNSLALWPRYANFGLLPTSTGNDLYYDCNSSGTADAGDGANYIQNIAFTTFAVLNSNTGFKETYAYTVGELTPNPANELVTLRYNLLDNAKQVGYTITDISGKTVLFENGLNNAPGRQDVNIDISTLSAGIYQLSVNVDGKVQTRKLVKN